jgi:hypothetical protein
MKNIISRNSIIILFLLCNISFSHAQDWLWTNDGHIKTDNEYLKGLNFVNDTVGNFIVTGYFTKKVLMINDIVFTNSDTSGQTYEAFIAKFYQGGVINWGYSLGGKSYDEGNAVCTDKNGNVYLTGDFRSAYIKIGNNTFANSNSGEYESDIFIVKYDKDGNLLWAKSGGGMKNDRGTGVTTDSLGNVFVTGSLLSYSAKFDKVIYSNPDSLNSVLGIDYIAKIDKDGNVISVMEKDKELKALKKSWSEVFQKCLAINKIKISCGGCYGVRYSVKISIDSNGKITNVVELENNQCGEKISESLKKCLMDYLYSYNFPPELRNQIIQLRVDRTLKC